MKYKAEIFLLILLILLMTATLSGCSDQPVISDVDESESSVAGLEKDLETVTDSETLTNRQVQMWSASCALCHVDGNAGAPIVGVPEHWQSRVASGMPTLLQHTIEGFNSMPPLGYCMACEREDFRAMILFMSKNHTKTGESAAMGELE